MRVVVHGGGAPCRVSVRPHHHPPHGRWVVRSRRFVTLRPTYISEDDAGVRPHGRCARSRVRYVRPVTWVERQLERLRAINSLVVDSLLAVVFLVIGLTTVYSQDIINGLSEPPARAVLTCLAVTAPVAIRRVKPLLALAISCAAVFVHIASGWPEGSLPMATLLLTYTVAAWDTPRRALVGLGVVYADARHAHRGRLTRSRHPRHGRQHRLLHGGVDDRRRPAGPPGDPRGPGAGGRANGPSSSARARPRAVAEERLRIAQELHDVVAHSMSVIAVQAGVGAHVLDDRPDQAASGPRRHLRDVPGDACRRCVGCSACCATTTDERSARARPGSRRPPAAGGRRAGRGRAGHASPSTASPTPRASAPESSCRPTASCRRRSPT